MSDKTDDNKKYIQVVKWLPYIASAFLVIAFAFYKYNFNGDFSEDREVWGWFGDFMGGVINPAIGVITIYILALAFKVQRVELSKTLKELARQNEITLNRAKISELMEAAKLINEELLRFYETEELVEITQTNINLMQVEHKQATLKYLTSNYIATNNLISQAQTDSVRRRLGSFVGHLLRLIECRERYLRINEDDEHNPLLDSILAYWEPVVRFLGLIDLPLDNQVAEYYDEDEETT